MGLLTEEVGKVEGLHMLLVGATKMGKTRYIANMLRDGFHIVYVDNDNGKSTLVNLLKDDRAALARCYLIRTSDLWSFTSAFFARNRFQWNLTKDKVFQTAGADPEDKVLTITRSSIPRGIIFVFDSWTTLSLQLLSDSADKNSASMESFGDNGRDIYGDANRRANTVAMNIQSFPFNVIWQAHPDYYERREASPGKVKDSTKEQELIIKENIKIPYSVSRPHGFTMGKFFNEIAWFEMTRMGQFIVSFEQKFDRIGGGSPGKDGNPETDLRFSKAFFPAPEPVGFDWLVEETAESYIEIAKQEAEARAAKQAAAKASSGGKPATAPTTTLPGRSLLGGK